MTEKDNEEFKAKELKKNPKLKDDIIFLKKAMQGQQQKIDDAKKP